MESEGEVMQRLLAEVLDKRLDPLVQGLIMQKQLIQELTSQVEELRDKQNSTTPKTRSSLDIKVPLIPNTPANRKSMIDLPTRPATTTAAAAAKRKTEEQKKIKQEEGQHEGGTMKKDALKLKKEEEAAKRAEDKKKKEQAVLEAKRLKEEQQKLKDAEKKAKEEERKHKEEERKRKEQADKEAKRAAAEEKKKKDADKKPRETEESKKATHEVKKKQTKEPVKHEETKMPKPPTASKAVHPPKVRREAVEVAAELPQTAQSLLPNAEDTKDNADTYEAPVKETEVEEAQQAAGGYTQSIESASLVEESAVDASQGTKSSGDQVAERLE
jgi:hypothetical protein